jgi:pimeloyl-ACP methyl ester carboxylesterase
MGKVVLARVTTLVVSMSLMGNPGTAMGAEPVIRVGSIVSETRTLTTTDGVTVNYELGTFYVPENRNRADSRPIGVGFARIRAPQPTGAPPVFWLPGGPGFSVLGAFEQSDAAGRGRLKSWINFGTVGDLVVVEQRGYTSRGEMLEVDADASPLNKPATLEQSKASALATARKALATFPDKDLAGYDIGAFADDVDDLREALGYRHITLFGGSFGSQWSFAVMRRHPGSVARAVLSGVEPLDNNYDMPSHVYASMRRIAFDADRDPGLKPYLPEGGTMAALRAVHDRLAAAPVVVSVTDKSSGKPVSVTLGVGDFEKALVERSAEASEWPAFVLSLYHRHYDDWARDTLEGRKAGKRAIIGPLVDTSLGVTPARAHQLRTDPAVGVLGSWNFAPYMAAADVWPTADMGDAFRDVVPTDIPVVFVHGDWDTSTPIENMLEVLPYYSQGHAIVVHRGGHDGTFYQLREDAKAKASVYAFMRTGSMEGLPSSVTLPLPTFAKPAFAANNL